MSGKSNVSFVLERHGVEPTDARIQAVLDKAKQSTRLLTDEEVLETAK